MGKADVHESLNRTVPEERMADTDSEALVCGKWYDSRPSQSTDCSGRAMVIQALQSANSPAELLGHKRRWSFLRSWKTERAYCNGTLTGS